MKNSLLSCQTSEKDLREIARVLQAEGVLVSSVCTELFWKYSLTSSNPSEAQQAYDLVSQMIRQSVLLGARSVVIVPGIVCTPPSPGRHNFQASEKVWQKSIVALSKLAEEAAKNDVVLDVENVYFNSFLSSPLEIRLFLEEIGHPSVKAHLDVGNANISGVAADWILTLGDLIGAIHLKDSVRWQSDLTTFRPLGSGSIDWSSVSQAIKNIGYDGFLIVEQSYSANLSPRDLHAVAIKILKGVNL